MTEKPKIAVSPQAVDGLLPPPSRSLAWRGMGYTQLSWLDRIAARLPAGTLAYKSPKYIKVDIPWLAVVHRILQGLVMMLAMIQLYFNDAWALTEVPSGNSNGWDEIGSMRTSTSDPMLSSRTRYCSNASHAWNPAWNPDWSGPYRTGYSDDWQDDAWWQNQQQKGRGNQRKVYER